LILASTGSEFGLILVPVTAYFGAFISLEAAALIPILKVPCPSSNYDLKKGKKVLFLDPEKDPYQYMVTEYQFRILRFSQK
jgi:hypothetical protein